MKFIFKLAKPFIKRAVIKEIGRNENRDKLITEIKAKISIPKLTKAEQRKLYNDLYDTITTNIITMIDRV